MCIALMDNKPVINIPGPPVAMFYGTDWCTRSIVYRMLNIPMPVRQTVAATLTEPIVAPPGMEILCFMELERSDKGWKTHQKTWRKTTMADNLGAGAIYITPLDKGIKEPGDIIEVTLLRGEEDF